MSSGEAESPAKKLPTRYYIVVLSIYVFLSFFSFRLIFSGGCMAINDLAPLYKFSQLFRPFEFPWDNLSGLGAPQFAVDNIIYNVPWILWSIITGSAVLSSKLIFCINLALAGFGFFLVFPRLIEPMSKVGAFVAGLSYMCNPWVLGRIIHGHNTILLGYAILPYALFFYLKTLQDVDFKHILACGLLSSLLLLVKVHMAYFFFILIFFHSFFYVLSGKKKAFKQRLTKQAFLVISIFALTIAVSFPILYHIQEIDIPIHVVYEEETVYYVINFSSFTPWDLLYVFLGASLTLWRVKTFKKESYPPSVLCFLCLCGLSIILANGSAWPTKPLYAFLFNYIPGFLIFTEANRFLFFPVVAVAFFLGCFVDRSFAYKATLVPINSMRGFLKQGIRLFTNNLPVLVLLILMFSSTWQFFTGDANGKLKPVNVPSYYEELDTWLRTQEGDFRIAFMPPACWATEYSWAPQRFIDPIAALPAQPTIVLGSERDTTLASSFVRWAYSSIYQNKTAYWGKLLGLMGVKYVVVRGDADLEARGDLRQFNLQNTLKILPNQRDLVLEKELSPLLIYKNPYCLPHISSAESLSLVAGDRRTLITLSYLPSFNFEEYPLAFLDNNIPLLELLPHVESIVLEGNRYWDFMLSCADESCIIRPWEHVKPSINERAQWIKGDLLWYFYGGALNVAPDNYVMTHGNSSIAIPFVIQKPALYKVLAQVYETSHQDFKGIKFKIDNTSEEVYIPSRSARLEGSFKWVSIGDYNLDAGQHHILITSLGGAAAVSKIAVIPNSSINSIERNLFKSMNASNMGLIYLFDDYSWSSNSMHELQTSVKYSNGGALRLSEGEICADFYIFKSGNYVPFIRILNDEPGASALKISIDNFSTVFHAAPNSSISSCQLKPIRLELGYHRMSLMNSENSSSLLLDNVALYYLGNDGNFGWTINPSEPVGLNTQRTHRISQLGIIIDAGFNVTHPIDRSVGSLSSFPQWYYGASARVGIQPVTTNSISYVKHSGSLYKVYPENNFLIFLEAHTRYWQLQCGKWKQTPFAIFGYANAFQLDKISSAQNEYSLVYLGLIYVKQGFILSILLIVFVLLAITYIRTFRYSNTSHKTIRHKYECVD